MYMVNLRGWGSADVVDNVVEAGSGEETRQGLSLEG